VDDSKSSVTTTAVESQVVSAPLASSPAALVVPAGHAAHAFELTSSLAAQTVASQVVSAQTSSPAALVVPAGHATHAFKLTISSAAQMMASQAGSTVTLGAGFATRVFRRSSSLS